MKISQGTKIAKELGVGLNPFETLRRIGYDACDYGEPDSMFDSHDPVYFANDDTFLRYFEEQYSLAREAGIVVGQVHAPYPTLAHAGYSDEEVLDGIRRAIVVASVMHAPYLVVHPAQPHEWANDDEPEKTKELNYNLFSSLIPTAREYGIILALENMPAHVGHIPCSSPDEWRAYVDMMNSDCFAACFDSGHANMARNYIDSPKKYTIDDYIHTMGNRIRCVHIHDNDGNGDDHTILGTCTTGSIPWKNLISALKNIGYAGTFNLESYYSTRLPVKIRPEAEKFQYDFIRSILEEEEFL